jgi:nitroimidazol reductase NimA-like FMN-containing flavoprotein (pyridoxamine 5'-phosphate oxidase superfamily)
MSEPTGPARNALGRYPQRGHYDRVVIDPILDEAIYCHLGIVRAGRPVVLPTLHVRQGDLLYVHGSAQSRLLLDGRGPVCITVTLLDGIVLARSAFHHSLNYRSVVVHGDAEWVEEEQEKRRALSALVEHVVPGRGGDCRPPSDEELALTAVLRIPLREASAKIRSGPPLDAPKDRALPHWAGVLPLHSVSGKPQADEWTPAELSIPPYLRDWARGCRP